MRMKRQLKNGLPDTISVKEDYQRLSQICRQQSRSVWFLKLRRISSEEKRNREKSLQGEKKSTERKWLSKIINPKRRGNEFGMRMTLEEAVRDDFE